MVNHSSRFVVIREFGWTRAERLRTRSRARGEGAYALHEEAQQILDDLNVRDYEGSERLCHAAVNKAKYQADIRLKRAGALCPQLNERYSYRHEIMGNNGQPLVVHVRKFSDPDEQKNKGK